MRELLAELTAAMDRGRPCAWCLVAETRGSTPQKAGAAMIVYDDGSQAGTLGGGCVEADVRRRALHALQAVGRPEVFTFHLDDDFGWADGLICGGRMTVLVQAVSAETANYYRRLRDFAEAGAGFTEAVVISDAAGLPVGDRFLFDEIGTAVGHLAERPNWPRAAAGLLSLTGRPGPGTRTGIAYLPTLPRITVFLVGGGHVGQAVGRLATEVGFEVWVLDDRDRFASPERFPTATRRLVGEIGPTLKEIVPTLTAATFAVILTRGHGHDEEALFYLATSACGYVGMIGSKRKIRLIFAELEERGIPATALERVHAPLGFDIGSQTVPEIAISIVAELIACRNLDDTALARRSWAKS